VIAGDTEVVGLERPGCHQPDTGHVTGHLTVQRIVAEQPEQPRSATGRGGLDHRGGRRDPRIAAAQVFLNLGEPGAEGWQRRCLRFVQAERDTQVLVDVRVDGDHRRARLGQVPGEQRRQRGFPAAALTHERDLHELPVDQMKMEVIFTE
jgi:hypothetical protein